MESNERVQSSHPNASRNVYRDLRDIAVGLHSAQLPLLQMMDHFYHIQKALLETNFDQYAHLSPRFHMPDCHLEDEFVRVPMSYADLDEDPRGTQIHPIR